MPIKTLASWALRRPSQSSDVDFFSFPGAALNIFEEFKQQSDCKVWQIANQQSKEIYL